MTVALVKYESARRALAEAFKVDEVKDIHDKAMAMRVYAHQAKDRQLIGYATDIQKRAEIRAGELLREMEKNKGNRNDGEFGGRKARPPNDTPTLTDLGVTKSQSSRWQQLAALPKDEQEEIIAKAKDKAQAALDVKPKSVDAAKPKSESRKRESAIGAFDQCVMHVRRTVFDAIQDISPEDVARLFDELRAELDDLEEKANARHHAARQSA